MRLNDFSSSPEEAVFRPPRTQLQAFAEEPLSQTPVPLIMRPLPRDVDEHPVDRTDRAEGTDDSSPLSIDDDSMSDISSLDEKPSREISTGPPERGPVYCPICSDPVGKETLDHFVREPSRMVFDEQMRFCTWHRRKSAQRTWDDRGYPQIDWNGLAKRIGRHHGHLGAILKGSPCHFRRALEEQVAAGKSRTLKKADERIIPGYYGLRGLQAMSRTIVDEFQTLLRTCAVQDRLISARGSMAFVQTVMVPELAVRLIMDDMKAGEERARAILYESAPLGELLSEDIPDVVAQDRDSGSDEDSDSELTELTSSDLES